MTSLNENQTVPAVLNTYNRVKTYRPHLSEENRCVLVQKKMLEEYGLTVPIQDLLKIVKVQENLKPESMKTVLKKKDGVPDRSDQEILPETRKREYQNFSNNILLTSAKSTPMNQARFTFRDISLIKINPDHNVAKAREPKPFTFKSISQTSSNQEDKADKGLNSSKIPRPVFKFKYPGINASTNTTLHSKEKERSRGKDVFDRLYEFRPKPCPGVIEKVESIRHNHAVKARTNKQPPKTKNCIDHEPPAKRSRYSKACLNDTLGTSVFERLYAERKQLNTKKLTDVQKRELYLKKQREQLKKARDQWNIHNRPLENVCQCERASPIVSSTSDFDKYDFMSGEDEVSDSTLVELTPASKQKRRVSFATKDEIIDSQTTESDQVYNETGVQNLLDLLAERFKDNMSLCPVDESDLQ